MSKNNRQYRWRVHWLRSLIVRTPFIGHPKMDGNTQEPTQQKASPLHNTYHHKCSTLPYSIFIEVMLTQNIALLIISGEPSFEELAVAWREILEEYSGLIKTNKSQSVFDCWKNIIITQHKLTTIGFALYALKIQYDAEIAEAVALHGYSLIEPLEDRQAYLTQIYAVETEAKTLVVLLNQYRAEYAKLCPEAAAPTAGSQADALQYDKELAILSRFMGYRIDKTLTTVAEYCAAANLYLEHKKLHKDGPAI